jgi:hypothetical protein
MSPRARQYAEFLMISSDRPKIASDLRRRVESIDSNVETSASIDPIITTCATVLLVSSTANLAHWIQMSLVLNKLKAAVAAVSEGSVDIRWKDIP